MGILADAKAETVPEEAVERVRVLVVEDDPHMRQAVREGLSFLGFSVTATADGLEGARLAIENEFDVVVSDIRLPGLSGTDLSRRIGSRPHPPKTILVTAYPDIETVREASLSGAVHLLSKPLSIRALAQAVHLAAMERKVGQTVLQRPHGWAKKGGT